MTAERPRPAGDDLKACCGALYASEWPRLLLGESFHPGGLALTRRLGALLALRPGTRVLDVAAGRGASAIALAERFGCAVLGVDYGTATSAAAAAAARAGVGDRVRFVRGDAERLPIAEGAIDAVVCECALCTFADKEAACAEFARVLRPGGRIGLSDLTRTGPLPPELDDLLAWVACVADARPIAEYAGLLEAAGFGVDHVEPHDGALRELVDAIRAKLLGAGLLAQLQGLDLPGVDLRRAHEVARRTAEAVRAGTLGYALLVATKRGDP